MLFFRRTCGEDSGIAIAVAEKRHNALAKATLAEFEKMASKASTNSTSRVWPN